MKMISASQIECNAFEINMNISYGNNLHHSIAGGAACFIHGKYLPKHIVWQNEGGWSVSGRAQHANTRNQSGVHKQLEQAVQRGTP